MLKKLLTLLLLSTTLFGENEFIKLFKYSTVYASFSLNAPRHQDDRFAIVGGLSTGELEIERTEMELNPDFQTSFGLRKVGRFNYEPKRGVKNAGNGGSWYDGSEQSANESATFGTVSGYEFLIKWSQGRQWGDDYINQEYWLRYTGDWWMAKVGYTELGLEEVEYAQGDLRFKYNPSFIEGLNLSVGIKHRQHPVYGFDAMVLDTTWYKGSWWDFAEDAFGWDDNAWVTIDENGEFVNGGTLLYWDKETESYIPVPGEGPFFYGNGEFLGYDYMWEDENGVIQAWTDREFFQYHFPRLLENYIDGLKKDLGYQRETSIVLGLDYYHYSDNWWLHMWGNWLPYHYGHDKYSFNNAQLYLDMIENTDKEANEFEFEEPLWHDWNDYDFGAIFGVKLKDNLGIFTEGRYLFYWERPAYDIKFGVNYQFIGF
ncbi:hypothetical protein H8D04_01550 [bacterium]|nr:hypothetical protein [bacterium]